MSTINEKLIKPADIWVSSLWQVICIFGVTECVFYVYIFLRHACLKQNQKVEEGNYRALLVHSCDVQQVVHVDWQAGAERLPG